MRYLMYAMTVLMILFFAALSGAEMVYLYYIITSTQMSFWTDAAIGAIIGTLIVTPWIFFIQATRSIVKDHW